MRLPRFLLPALAVISLTAGGYVLWRAFSPPSPPSPELATPKLAMEHVRAQPSKPLFFNLSALPYLKQRWKVWGPTFGTPGIIPEDIAVQFDATVQSPQAWRVLDRKWHFGAVLLSGDPVNFRPLLEHLLKSPDWTLTHVDPTSLVFERSPAQPWAEADLQQMLAVFKTHSAEEQKNARIQVAHRLLFVERLPAAKELLEEVLKGAPKCVPALTELASLHGMAGQWQDAMTLAGRALSFDRRYRPAQIVMANASYAMGRFDAALDMTRSLYASAPGDGQTLLLHAKVTHAAHAYREEIDVLQNVISIMLGKQQPLGVWQIYLGQANAAIGEGVVARELFKEALKDTTLSESDRAFAEKAVERYAPKADMLNSTPSLPESSLLDAPAYRP